MEDLIHIYVTTYNREKFLPATIQSILNQTYRDIKLIVLDNCSTDRTEEIVKSFSDERIQYIKHEKNIGGFGNVSYPFLHATSKYFVIFHDDDVMKPDFVENQLAVMEADPEISVVTCLADAIDSDGKYIYRNPQSSGKVITYSGCQLFDMYMDHKWNIVFPTAMYRREFIENNRIRPKAEVGPAGDVVVFLDIEKNNGTVAVIQKAFADHRTHAAQDSQVNRVALREKLFQYFRSDSYYKSLLDDAANKQSGLYRHLMKNEICLAADRKSSVEELINTESRYRRVLKVDCLSATVVLLILKIMYVCPALVRACYLTARSVKRRLI